MLAPHSLRSQVGFLAGECTLCRCSLHAHQAGLPTPCLVGNDNTTACSKLSAPRHPGVAGVAKYVASLMDTEHEMCNSQRAYCVCRCHQGSASLESPGMTERSGASQNCFHLREICPLADSRSSFAKHVLRHIPNMRIP